LLSAALHELDSMPTRNTENVYILYVRTGQTKLTDIFRNKASSRCVKYKLGIQKVCKHETSLLIVKQGSKLGLQSCIVSL
jgi:hypothetical protein